MGRAQPPPPPPVATRTIRGDPLPALPPVERRLAPYAASQTAALERTMQEERVKVKMAERQRRRDAAARERLRLQVLDLALEDFSSQAKPIALAAAIEEAKRRDAALAVQRVEEAYTQQRSQLLNRWYEPSLEERAEREYLFEQRRYEFGLQRDARRAMQQMTIDARTMELARQSEEKLERARTRQSAFMESRVASCQALNSSASAPQLAEPVRTASY